MSKDFNDIRIQNRVLKYNENTMFSKDSKISKKKDKKLKKDEKLRRKKELKAEFNNTIKSMYSICLRNNDILNKLLNDLRKT